ncbi:MAG TPA: hypothetical protein VGI39_45660 [Polyangiaceae bacterium]
MGWKRTISGATGWVAIAGVSLLSAATTTRAEAAEPTTSDCLFARDSALTLQSKHQLRAARAQLEVCEANACPTGIRAECAKRHEEVQSAMPTLLFVAEDAQGRSVSKVKVAMDGEPLLSELTGTSVGVDPGQHVFTFEVPGKPRAAQTFDLTEGEKNRRIKLEIVPPTPPAQTFGRTQRIVGLSFGAAALVGVGLGTGFGISARSNLTKSHEDCNTSLCTQQGWSAATSEMSTATTQATISTAAFIAAGAFLATGALLYFTAPTGPSTNSAFTLAPAVGSGTGGLLVQGTF